MISVRTRTAILKSRKICTIPVNSKADTIPGKTRKVGVVVAEILKGTPQAITLTKEAATVVAFTEAPMTTFMVAITQAVT